MSLELLNLEIPNIPQEHEEEAKNKAKEAYVMTLLKYHHISAGKTAKLLGINRWQLSNLMSAYNISPFPEQTQEDLEKEVTQTIAILELGK
jgi:DNA-binding NtrC family response regulator